MPSKIGLGSVSGLLKWERKAERSKVVLVSVGIRGKHGRVESSNLVMYNVAVSLSLTIRKYITDKTCVSNLNLRACRSSPPLQTRRPGESLPVIQQSDMSPPQCNIEGFRPERLRL